MKTNISRILCLVMVLLMAFSVFAGCSKEDDTTKTPTATDTPAVELQEDIIVEVDEDAPYAIAEDQEEIFLKAEDDGSIVLVVPEKTTVEALLKVVTAKDGYTVKVVDAEGKEVTDAATAVADKMVLNVVKDGEDTAEVTLTISVLTEKEIQSIQKEQKEVDDNNKKVPSTDKDDSKDESKTDTNNKTSNTTTVKSKITLCSVWSSSYTASDSTGEAWKSTFATMKSKNGIETTVTNIAPDSATDTIVKDVMAGKSTADVYDVSLVMCRNIARKKAAANIYESTTLNKSLYNCAATESVTFGGKAYGVTFAAKSVNPMGVIYNKELVKKYAANYDIVKLYNEKKWTFDTFQAIAKLCTVDTNGDNATDIYGFTSNTNIIGMALTANAGGTALMKSGKVEATMCNESGIEALEWCKTMFKTDRTWLYKAAINDCVDQFAAGKAAMFVSYFQYGNTIAAKANFSLGFVLMPMGPDQSTYKNGVYDSALFVVPKTNEDKLDEIGNWLNGVANVAGKLTNIQLTNMARNGFDSTAQSIYKYLINNMSAEYSSGCFSTSTSSAVDTSVTSASKSPSKVMAQIKSSAQKECDDFYGPLY